MDPGKWRNKSDELVSIKVGEFHGYHISNFSVTKDVIKTSIMYACRTCSIEDLVQINGRISYIFDLRIKS